MPFRQQLLSFLKVFAPNGKVAIWIRTKPNFLGSIGNAVIEFYTGGVVEAQPARISALDEIAPPYSGAPNPRQMRVVITSPLHAGIEGETYYAVLEMGTQDTYGGVFEFFKFDCNYVVIKPVQGDTSNAKLVVGRIEGPSDSLTDTTLRLGKVTHTDDAIMATGKRVIGPTPTALTLVNGWANFGGSFANAFVVQEAGEYVQLGGFIKHATTTQTGTVAVIPAALCPPTAMAFISYAGGGFVARIQILSTGEINIITYLGGTAGASSVSLDGIRYRVP